MAIPLNYQISEFDCCPVSLLNALNLQFDRKLIQPCIIKAIYTYTLDCCDSRSRPGQKVTAQNGTIKAEETKADAPVTTAPVASSATFVASAG